MDFDRGFSSGFSPPDIFRTFSVFAHAHGSQNPSQNPSLSLGKDKRKNPPQNPSPGAEKSIAKSVTAIRKIRRNSTQLRCAPYNWAAAKKWGFKGCLAALPRNRPKSAFFALSLPFSPFSGGPEEHLGNQRISEEKRPFSSDIL